MPENRTVNSPSQGIVVLVRGSVVDVRFDAALPPIYTVLRTGLDKKIVIEVLAQLDARHVRGIAHKLYFPGLVRPADLRRAPEGEDTRIDRLTFAAALPGAARADQ